MQLSRRCELLEWRPAVTTTTLSTTRRVEKIMILRQRNGTVGHSTQSAESATIITTVEPTHWMTTDNSRQLNININASSASVLSLLFFPLLLPLLLLLAKAIQSVSCNRLPVASPVFTLPIAYIPQNPEMDAAASILCAVLFFSHYTVTSARDSTSTANTTDRPTPCTGYT